MTSVSRTAHPRRIAVLGEMLELGAVAPELHRGLAESIDAAGIDLVFAAGTNMRHLFEALPADRQGAWAETVDGIRDAVLGTVRKGDVVMVKGSNGSRSWQIVAALKSAMSANSDKLVS
jgi:UDP-N-acetylmuramoyl-tripeptide--D-alanyl-D-alanine ligase